LYPTRPLFAAGIADAKEFERVITDEGKIARLFRNAGGCDLDTAGFKIFDDAATGADDVVMVVVGKLVERRVGTQVDAADDARFFKGCERAIDSYEIDAAFLWKFCADILRTRGYMSAGECGKNSQARSGGFQIMAFEKSYRVSHILDEACDDEHEERAEDWGGCVHEQESARSPCRILVCEHERNRIHPVGKRVRNDSKRNDSSDGIRNLKSETDSNAVDEAVPCECERRKYSDVRMFVICIFVFMRMVNSDRLFKNVEDEESSDKRDHWIHRIDTVLSYHLDDLGKNIKSYNAEQYARRKAHDEVQAIFVLYRKKSAKEYGDKCRERK
jgi:hypothetical protein